MNDKNKTTDKAPSVREQLAKLLAHRRTLEQAKKISVSEDPIEAAKRIRAVREELADVDDVTAQLEGALSADEQAIRDARRAELDAKAQAIRPRETEAFKAIVTKAAELQAAIDTYSGVAFELAAVGTWPFTPGAVNLARAIDNARTAWSMDVLGRECLSIPAEPSYKEAAISEARERVKRVHDTLDMVRAAKVSNEGDSYKSQRAKELEAALADAVLDVQVLEGKAVYPDPPKLTKAEWDSMTDLQRLNYRDAHSD